MLDVRDAGQFAKEHIPGAVNIDWRLLTDGLTCFAAHCVEVIEFAAERMRSLLNGSLMLVTALMPRLG